MAVPLKTVEIFGCILNLVYILACGPNHIACKVICGWGNILEAPRRPRVAPQAVCGPGGAGGEDDDSQGCDALTCIELGTGMQSLRVLKMGPRL